MNEPNEKPESEPQRADANPASTDAESSAGVRRCPSCEYEATGLDLGGTCPECGADWSVSAPPEPAAESIAKEMGPAFYLLLAAAILPVVGSYFLFRRMDDASGWLAENAGIALSAYVVFFALTSGIAVLPTYAQSALGGFAFGLTRGGIGAIAGYFFGSVLGYEIARRLGTTGVNRVIEARPKWRAVRDAFVGSERGFLGTLGMVVLIRIPFNSPFALTNMMLASVGVSRPIYWLGTLIGMAPRTLLVVWIGSEIRASIGDGELTREALKSGRPDWYLPVLIGSVLVTLIIVTVIANRAIERLGDDQSPVEGEG